jgi:hypothetical protein
MLLKTMISPFDTNNSTRNRRHNSILILPGGNTFSASLSQQDQAAEAEQ